MPMQTNTVLSEQTYQAPQVQPNQTLAQYILSEQSLSIIYAMLTPAEKPAFDRAIRALLVEYGDSFADCSPKSVFLAIVRAVSLGLRLERDFGHVWLIPYTTGGKRSVQLQVGYKGLIFQAIRSGRFRKINACVVYENDTDETVQQRLFGILPPRGNFGNIIGFIAGFQTIDEPMSQYTEFMSYEDMERHKHTYSQSADSKGSAWSSSYIPMALKTVMKRLIMNKAIHYALLEGNVIVPVMETAKIDQLVFDGETEIYADNPQNNDGHEPQLANTSQQDLRDNPERFKLMVEKIMSGHYPKAKALDNSKILLTAEQRATVEGISNFAVNPINLSQNPQHFEKILLMLKQGHISKEKVLSPYFLLSPEQIKKVKRL